MLIKVESSKNTGFDNEFRNVDFIEIENSHFASGSFGEVYKCVSVNGISTKLDQVVKIFISDSLSDKMHATVLNLQHELIQQFDRQGIKITDAMDLFPALLGAPQLSFVGEMEGKMVYGFLSNNLNSLGFSEYGELVRNNDLTLRSLHLSQKIEIAYQLVQTFDLLRKCSFVHADLKDEAIFIDLENTRCAIIDFDGGAVLKTSNAYCTTIGTSQDWLAPEVLNHMFNSGTISSFEGYGLKEKRVSLLSDVWSLAIFIHYLFFGIHPYDFLTEITTRSLENFKKANLIFPDIPESFEYFNNPNLDVFLKYVENFKNQLPLELQKLFAVTFTQGALDPGTRPTCRNWMIALDSCKKKPQIVKFEPRKHHLTNKNPILFNWDVEFAQKVTLSGIRVKSHGSIALPLKKDTEVILEARNHFGNTQSISVIETSKEPPNILQFESNCKNSKIQNSSPIQLSWQIENFEKIRIDPDIGDVSSQTSIEVPAPNCDTKYVLTATSVFGQVKEKYIILKVNSEPPAIISFESDLDLLPDGNTPGNLSWVVTNAVYVEIDQGIGEVSNVGTISVLPRMDTVYTLIARSYFGVINTKEIRVKVSQEPPEIRFFRADKFLLFRPEIVQLEWEVEGAEIVKIEDVVEDVPSSGKLSVLIKNQRSISITATTYFGIEAKKIITIFISKAAPFIKKFTSKFIIDNPAESNFLTWNIVNASEVLIEPGVGKVSNFGKAEIDIDKDTVFKLSATNSFGIESISFCRIKISKSKPLIKSFRSNKLLLLRGNSLELSWKVVDAISVELHPNFNSVQSSGKILVKPQQDITYTLIARNKYGFQSEAHLYIKVRSSPILVKLNPSFKTPQFYKIK